MVLLNRDQPMNGKPGRARTAIGLNCILSETVGSDSTFFGISMQPTLLNTSDSKRNTKKICLLITRQNDAYQKYCRPLSLENSAR
jgi:hypothetical protein